MPAAPSCPPLSSCLTKMCDILCEVSPSSASQREEACLVFLRVLLYSLRISSPPPPSLPWILHPPSLPAPLPSLCQFCTRTSLTQPGQVGTQVGTQVALYFSISGRDQAESLPVVAHKWAEEGRARGVGPELFWHAQTRSGLPCVSPLTTSSHSSFPILTSDKALVTQSQSRLEGVGGEGGPKGNLVALRATTHPFSPRISVSTFVLGKPPCCPSPSTFFSPGPLSSLPCCGGSEECGGGLLQEAELARCPTFPGPKWGNAQYPILGLQCLPLAKVPSRG